MEKLFTCVSAFASVGFDLGITARLDRWGQLVLLVGMFIGRLGILLLLSALFGRRPPAGCATHKKNSSCSHHRERHDRQALVIPIQSP